ncbi:MAG: hypothetical protein KDJ52_23765 [Anaerolineae bacterium]|nr:hypothetical protein [Anaerolineae bacterium]
MRITILTFGSHGDILSYVALGCGLKLAAALQKATSDTSMRRRATEISRNIRAEDGVARTVKVVKSYLG